MQILLVEDDIALADSLAKALKKQLYAVNTVDTGTATLTAINAEPPDMVILDLGLPLPGNHMVGNAQDSTAVYS